MSTCTNCDTYWSAIKIIEDFHIEHGIIINCPLCPSNENEIITYLPDDIDYGSNANINDNIINNDDFDQASLFES